jgi:hypothetical protein
VIVFLHSYKDRRPRAYKHSEFVWSLNARGRGQQWAADRVKAAIEAHRKAS